MNGWLLLDKPEGISSANALNFVKKLFRQLGLKHLKIGHAGTLDPFACGLLLIAVGEATKTINYIIDAKKTYDFTIKWGENRDTIDREGIITATSSYIPTLEEIKSAVQEFTGEILQVPPIYSAVKVNGQRAYSLARKGEEVKLEAKKVVIYNLSVLTHQDDYATFSVECGKGFYVRSLARDIATKLGICGYVSFLKRTCSKKFKIEDAFPLDKIKILLHNEDQIDSLQFLRENLKPISSVLDDILVWKINETDAKRLKTGQSVHVNAEFQENATIATFNESKLIAICTFENGQLKPKRVFNL